MKQYLATLRQDKFTDVTIDAETPEEAETLIRQGEGESGQPSYSDETVIVTLQEVD